VYNIEEKIQLADVVATVLKLQTSNITKWIFAGRNICKVLSTIWF